MKREPRFATEADLVAAFCAVIDKRNASPNPRCKRWTVYHETADWDLLLVDNSGVQVGLEAKLSLNAKVLVQALPDYYAATDGPDYRGVLVPHEGTQHFIPTLARHLGIGVVEMRRFSEPALPDEESDWSMRGWHSWCPAKRCALPDYVPDVTGGKPSPVKLTDWKVRAIKLMIVLDRRGYVTRHDMKLLGISPTRWTASHHGFLVPDPIKGGYVPGARTPDFRTQHPTNYAEIEADFAKWAPPALLVAA